MQKTKLISLLAGAMFACHPAAHAIDVDAGDYSVAPGGTNVFLLYGQHATRNSSYTNGTRNPDFLTSTTQLTATYGRDLSVRNGFKEAHRVNLRLLQVF